MSCQWEDATTEALVVELKHVLAAEGDAAAPVLANFVLDEAITSARSFAGDLVLEIRLEQIAHVAAVLKDRFRYTFLIDLCGADHPGRVRRFEVIYLLYSFRENRRVRLKVATDGQAPVPSVGRVWRGAIWAEREVFDMYGVRFSHHPGLERILLWEGFEGHPLRKDFPLAGKATGAAGAPSGERGR